MKKAIVVGASSGIGKALAQILVANNYQVGITGRRAHLLEALKNEHPNNYIIQPLDNTEITSIPIALEALKTALGGLDLLVISSGTGFINKSLDLQLELITIDTNVRGFSAVANWAFKLFEQQGHGHLVGIGSIAGIRGSRLAPAYNASKSFQINYLEGLRQRAKKLKSHIFVTDIRPGFVDTEMAKGDGIFWVASPEKAARQIYHAIRRKARIAYISKRWNIIAVILKIVPKFIYDRI